MQESPDQTEASSNPYRPPVAPHEPLVVPPALPPQRPLPITIVCIVGVLGILMVMPIVFSQAARNIGGWYPPFLALSGVVGSSCLYGFWKMRRWAFFTYIAMAVIGQTVMFAKGVWMPSSPVAPLVFIGIVALYYKRLR